jgi:hypothetical protein
MVVFARVPWDVIPPFERGDHAWVWRVSEEVDVQTLISIAVA